MKHQKQSQLKSSLDNHSIGPGDSQARPQTAQPKNNSYEVKGKLTMANKQAHLASDLITGKSAMDKMNADHTKVKVIDLDLGQLPEHID